MQPDERPSPEDGRIGDEERWAISLCLGAEEVSFGG